MYHEAVNRWRRAERRYAVFLYLAHYLFGGKLLVFEHENHRPREPLSVQFAPRGLAPARVGDGQMDAVFSQVVPESACCYVPEGVKIIVGYHLRLAACTAGEVHQHGVVVAVDVLRAHKLRRVSPLLVPVVEAVARLRPYAYKRL